MRQCNTTASDDEKGCFLCAYKNDSLTITTITKDRVNEDLIGTFTAFLVADLAISFSASSTYFSSIKR